MRVVDVVFDQSVAEVVPLAGLLPHQHRQPLYEDLRVAADIVLSQHKPTFSRARAVRFSAISWP